MENEKSTTGGNPDLPGRVDEALDALWRGHGEPLDLLIREDGDESPPGSRLGNLLGDVFREFQETLVDVSPVQINGYEVGPVLGRGGMGTVFTARQLHPNRLVALKVLSAASEDDPYRRALFQREVESLARLKHPAIASIFESGLTRDGRQFFAMELVEGVSLRQWLSAGSSARSGSALRSAARDALRERLKLFGGICDGVHYAHQRGVIHRDLKPSNIMIDPAARPRILDFGLARVMDSDVTLVTGAGDSSKLLGTLAYMSPEQATADVERIDVRTDVYSLGVLLYEMITGRLPYHVGALPHHAARVICEQPPSRPSGLVSGIDNDLETIALKALEKEPARRYQSALALAEDVERYLANQPILAKPPSALYQLRKIAVRHFATTVISAALVLLAIAFGIVTTIQSGRIQGERDAALKAGVRETKARDRAETEANNARDAARRARKTAAFLGDMLRSADPHVQPEEMTVLAMLDDAAQTARLDLSADPQVKVEVMDAIGSAYAGLGHYVIAQQHLSEALETARASLGEKHELTARVLSHHGDVSMKAGDLATAERELREAVEFLRQAPEADPLATAEAINSLGLLLKARTRLEEAQAYLEEALSIAEREAGPISEPVAMYVGNVGSILRERGLPAAAEPLLRRSVDIRRELLGSERPHPAVATGLNNLGGLLLEQKRYGEVEPLWREALDIRLTILGDAHPQTAVSCNNLAELLRRMGFLDEAECRYAQAAEIARRAWGAEHPTYLVLRHNFAVFLLERGRSVEAERILIETLDARRRVLGERSIEVARTLEAIGQLQFKADSCSMALDCFEQALDIKVEILGATPPASITTRGNVARICFDCGDLDAAERGYRQALLHDEQRSEPTPVDRAQLLLPLARILFQRQQDEEAVEMLYEASLLLQEAAPGGTPLRVEVLTELGAHHLHKGAFHEAERTLLEAYRLLASLQSTSPSLLYSRTAESLTKLYEAWNKPDLAAKYRDSAVQENEH